MKDDESIIMEMTFFPLDNEIMSAEKCCWKNTSIIPIFSVDVIALRPINAMTSWSE